MQTNILWTGREYYSLENCLIRTTGQNLQVDAAIIGQYNSKLYRVEYQVTTNLHWQTLSVEIKMQCDNKIEQLNFTGDGQGNWTTNGKNAPEFKGCIDVDISLTPFTNTLAVNRLHLAIGQAQEIQVLYFDLLDFRVKPAVQKYTRLSAADYKFENVPNDFEAEVKFDENGFVVDYPLLFKRTAIIQTAYP